MPKRDARDILDGGCGPQDPPSAKKGPGLPEPVVLPVAIHKPAETDAEEGAGAGRAELAARAVAAPTRFEPGETAAEEAQARRQYVDWQLEDVGEQSMPLRYCCEQPPPLAAILKGIPVHVNLSGGRKRQGQLKFNPVMTRWLVAYESSNVNLVDFCDGALLPKSASHTASTKPLTGWLPRDVLIETETEKPALPVLEPFTLPTRQWFIFNKEEILGQDADTIFPQLSTKTSRRSLASAGRRGTGAVAGRICNAPDILKKKKEDGPPNPFNIQGWRFVPVIPDSVGVCLSPCDRDPAVRLITPLAVAGNKGYRTVRASCGVSRGAWLFELTIKDDTPQLNVDERFNLVQGHVRVGWARSQAKLQAPVGFDRFGYGFASKTGQKIHQQKLESCFLTSCPLKPGDVVGCYICLPALRDKDQAKPKIYTLPEPPRPGEVVLDGDAKIVENGGQEGTDVVMKDGVGCGELSEYEKQRMDRIKGNQKVLQNLGLHGPQVMGEAGHKASSAELESGLGAGRIHIHDSTEHLPVDGADVRGDACISQMDGEPDAQGAYAEALAAARSSTPAARPAALVATDGMSEASSKDPQVSDQKDPASADSSEPGVERKTGCEKKTVTTGGSTDVAAGGEGDDGNSVGTAEGGAVGADVTVGNASKKKGGKSRSKRDRSRSVKGGDGGPGESVAAASSTCAGVMEMPKMILKAHIPQPGGKEEEITVKEVGPVFGKRQEDQNKRDVIQWRDGTEYYLDVDEEMGAEKHADSVIAFFVNGRCDHIAFKEIEIGTYFPAVSPYMGGTAEVNFGPDFVFPPSESTLAALNLQAPQAVIALQHPRGCGCEGCFQQRKLELERVQRLKERLALEKEREEGRGGAPPSLSSLIAYMQDGMYECNEDDTPKMVAGMFGVDVQALVKMNKPHLGSALTTNARLLKGTKLLLPMPNDEKLGPSENEGGSVGTSGAVASIEEPIAVGAGAANEDTTSAVDFPDTTHASFSRSLGSVSHDTRTENTAVEKVA